MLDRRPLDLVVHGARAAADELRAAVTELRARGHPVRVHMTWERGDARRFAARAARRATRDGAGVVVAAGGDGTLNEVVNGVLAASPPGRPVPVAVVPLGTANDFARQARVPADPGAALALAAEGEPTRVDVGRVNGRAFLNVSTLGAGAEVTSETGATAKQTLGVLAYALTGVRRFVAGDQGELRARVSGPAFSRELPFVLLAVGNARTTGAGTIVTPLAAVDDGLLDVCIVEPVARLEYARLLLELRRGEHLARGGVHYVQTPWLRVEAGRPLAANVDGESIRARRLHYAAEPLAAAVVLGPRPADA